MPEKSPLVTDVMQSSFVVIDGMATVRDALLQMHEANSDVLIVDKRTDDDEHGIVLLTDIVSAVLAPNRAPERVHVYEIMSKPVVTVHSGMSVKNCARLFANIGVSAAPVLRDGAIAGIVTYRELAFAHLNNESES
ncbi:MAG: CBS domain-containing protein [Gammaproteobacteria bacterium]|nr:CBS domain-containing protein [Gammaproteobacteria bacterium]